MYIFDIVRSFKLRVGQTELAKQPQRRPRRPTKSQQLFAPFQFRPFWFLSTIFHHFVCIFIKMLVTYSIYINSESNAANRARCFCRLGRRLDGYPSSWFAPSSYCFLFIFPFTFHNIYMNCNDNNHIIASMESDSLDMWKTKAKELQARLGTSPIFLSSLSLWFHIFIVWYLFVIINAFTIYLLYIYL